MNTNSDHLAKVSGSDATAREVVFGCHIDIGPDERPDGCVFDSGDICDCRIAETLQAAGKGRDECAYWKPVTFTKGETVSDILLSREALRASHGALVKALEDLITSNDRVHQGVYPSNVKEESVMFEAVANAWRAARAALADAQKVTA
jgi:hypothetical protein